MCFFSKHQNVTKALKKEATKDSLRRNISKKHIKNVSQFVLPLKDTWKGEGDID